MSISVTESELLEALALAGAAPDDARTVAEMAELTGYGTTKLRQTLGALAKAGRLRTHRVKRETIDGRAATVPAYTILPAA